MGDVFTLAFALGVGLACGGLIGSVMEQATGMRLVFAEPFVTRRRISRSLIASAVAGPFMLTNEALRARRNEAIGSGPMMGAIAVALVWALALGVLVLNVAAGAVGL
ncbi:MAG: hypothetical protein WBA44_06010 [Mesorhizobium sp.]